MDRLRNKLVSFILLVTRTLPLTNTLAYFDIRDVFVVQALRLIFFPGQELAWSVFKEYRKVSRHRLCFKLSGVII
jgi:hypothetical protein